jgi:hypothetical protein
MPFLLILFPVRCFLAAPAPKVKSLLMHSIPPYKLRPRGHENCRSSITKQAVS